jgi:hypothetical protein
LLSIPTTSSATCSSVDTQPLTRNHCRVNTVVRIVGRIHHAQTRRPIRRPLP